MINLLTLERWRDRAWEARIWGGYRTYSEAHVGAFLLPCPATGETLAVIATAGDGWDHVSVSCEDRCPTWAEMDFVYETFFRPGETAMQLHVPDSDHVNHNPFTLHLWRPRGMQKIPRPPSSTVGPEESKGRRREQAG